MKVVRSKDFQEVAVLRGGRCVLRGAQAYGFRSIQNLVRKIRSGRCPYDIVEVMACPSGAHPRPLCSYSFFASFGHHNVLRDGHAVDALRRPGVSPGFLTALAVHTLMCHEIAVPRCKYRQCGRIGRAVSLSRGVWHVATDSTVA